MTNKTLASLALAAGCAFALTAMPVAHAQLSQSQSPAYAAPVPAPGTAMTATEAQPPAYAPTTTTTSMTSSTSAAAGPGYGTAAAQEPAYRGMAAEPPAYSSAQLVTNGPQASPRYGDWSARENVILSRRYDRLLRTNLAFRHFRARKECDPITLPALRERCLASFQRYEPVMVGSSYAPRHYRHRSGAGY